MAPRTTPPFLQHDLVLVGGGHAHVEVLRRFGRHPLPGLRLTLISSAGTTPYSGMLPGLIAGHYRAEETHVELRPLCQFAGAQFIQAPVTGLDLDHRRVLFADRPALGFDTLSLNTGSTPDLVGIPGALEWGLPIKPVERFLAQWPSLLQRLSEPTEPGQPFRIAVVGGGAGSIELVLALHHRLATRHALPPQPFGPIEFHLVTAAAAPLPNHSRAAQQLIARALRQKAIAVHLRQRVVGASPRGIVCASGKSLPCDALFWATNAAAPRWFVSSGLATDASGFLRVHPTLQSLSHPFVFAAGDAASVEGHPRPKSGVFAVRQGPPLAENLRRQVLGEPPIPFTPQRSALSLLATGGRHAIASYGPIAFAGSWVWTLKDTIDRRWMRQYQVPPAMMRAPASRPFAINRAPGSRRPRPPAPATHPSGETAERPRCGGCAAKVPADALHRVLQRLQTWPLPEVLVGLSHPDDGSVIRPPPGKLLVQTADVLRPFLGDPYRFSRIATLHALNDLFALGAEPHSALAQPTVPFGTPRIVEETLFQVLQGVVSELNAHETALIGGHSSEGAELSLGLTLNGFADEDGLLLKGGLKPGDRLVLTKPLGTGTLFAAEMLGRAKSTWIEGALTTMEISGWAASRCLRAHGAVACTDVSGFGLVGHLLEMLRASRVTASVRLGALPVLGGAEETSQRGWLSSLHPENLRLRAALAGDAKGVECHDRFALAFDPQTSGGLLAGLPTERAAPCLAQLHTLGYPEACIVGEVHATAPASPGSGRLLELLA